MRFGQRRTNSLHGLSDMGGGRGDGALRLGKAPGTTWWKVQLLNHSALWPAPPWVTQVFPAGSSLWRQSVHIATVRERETFIE